MKNLLICLSVVWVILLFTDAVHGESDESGPHDDDVSVFCYSDDLGDVTAALKMLTGVKVVNIDESGPESDDLFVGCYASDLSELTEDLSQLTAALMVGVEESGPYDDDQYGCCYAGDSNGPAPSALTIGTR